MSQHALKQMKRTEYDLFIKAFVSFLIEAAELLLSEHDCTPKKKCAEQNLMISLTLLSNLHETIVSKEIREKTDGPFTLPFDEKQQLQIRELLYELKSRLRHLGTLSKTTQSQCDRLILLLMAYYPRRDNVRIIIESPATAPPWLACP
ncbi:hypothetical protein [Jeotgalibacillus campisalis]|uniref:Uncharacterized protein n=1 Tax=Jeotgalibacillus campisalis TaxID=220754 RepID=A0A0C2RZ57_9BACL|nr:hypothetical protein [Jeotgalibacillus campisalis]KIL47069.1 hypothetical protein KR50_23910 [Jeotgalibacillus campisalis]